MYMHSVIIIIIKHQKGRLKHDSSSTVQIWIIMLPQPQCCLSVTRYVFKLVLFKYCEPTDQITASTAVSVGVVMISLLRSNSTYQSSVFMFRQTPDLTGFFL